MKIFRYIFMGIALICGLLLILNLSGIISLSDTFRGVIANIIGFLFIILMVVMGVKKWKEQKRRR